MVRVLFAVILIAGVASPTSAIEYAHVPGPRVGEPAPSFDLPTLNGNHITLASLRGKTVVINAWATWCPPCRQETPDLIAAHKRLAGKDVVFVGVDSTEKADVIEAFVTAKNIRWTQAVDSDKSFLKAYDIRYFPTTLVIDPHGILRMRYVDVVTVKLLAGFVTDAQAGRNGRIVSKLQANLDALLAPSRYPLGGDAAAIITSVGRIRSAIADADARAANSDPAHGNPVDLVRTQAEENALREAAIAALAPRATSRASKVTLDLLEADVDSYEARYPGALSAYKAAAALEPKNADALSGIAQSARQLHEYTTVVGADQALVALDQNDVPSLVQLGVDAGTAGQFDRARAIFDRAVAVATRKADAFGAQASDIRALAFAHLYYGRTETKAGNAQRAKRQFALAAQTALRLPKSDPRYAIYLEQAQEGTVALDLGNGPHDKLALSIAPWTGPELPGSSPGTAKYRLVIAGRPNTEINLSASGLPKGWIASFCTDRFCAPLRLTTTLSTAGLRVIEFQLVPPDVKLSAHLPHVQILASDGTSGATIVT